MSWNWSPDHDPETQNGAVSLIDRLARKLASASGEDWDRMNSYPGYTRGKWHAIAEELMAA